MSDLIFLAVIVGFFALAVGLLRACEHIVGPDPAPSPSAASSSAADGGTGATPAEVTA